VTDLIWLDDAGCLDARTCGDKAARLARARGHGFPVLPGFVVPASASLQVLEHAVATSDTGVFGARLTVMDSDVAALAPAVEAARRLAPSVVVRSSSPVEGSGRWAGAFSSYIGVPPDDVPTAVRGVWSSAIVDHLDQDDADLAVEKKTPEHVEMAVLVQPEVTPELSGTARVERDGSVSVVSTQGAPAALVAGWARGTTSRVDRTGDVQSNETDPAHREIVGRVAALAAALRDTTGDDLLEWAALAGDVVLLQCRQGEDTKPHPTQRPVGVPGLLPVARVAHRFAGPLGEHLALPWLLAARHVPATRAASAEPPTPEAAGRLGERWQLAISEATTLAASVWPGEPDPAEATRRLLRELQGPAPDLALAAVATLPAPDAATVQRLLGELTRLADALVRRDILRSPADLWLLEPDEVSRLVAGGQVGNLDLPQRARRAALRWEPLLFAALATDGQSLSGTPVAAGIGAGPCFVADAADAPAHAPARSVIVARYPLPRFAPLLWSASGLVTAEGSEGAHLIEVARSLGVPAVVGCSEVARVGLTDAALVAVDGERGTVSFDVR
jgi:phosphohistidine swiveling domain-containing protein